MVCFRVQFVPQLWKGHTPGASKQQVPFAFDEQDSAPVVPQPELIDPVLLLSELVFKEAAMDPAATAGRRRPLRATMWDMSSFNTLWREGGFILSSDVFLFQSAFPNFM